MGDVTEIKKDSEQQPEHLKELTLTINRLSAYVTFVLANERAGSIPVNSIITEMYVQTAFNHAHSAAVGEIVAEKFNIPHVDISNRVIELVKQKLSEAENGMGIVINPDGVVIPGKA